MLGASTVIGTAIYSIAPTQTQESQSSSESQRTHMSESFESTKDRGLQPNIEPEREDQIASQTTGANTRKGNAVESVPDAKALRRSASLAKMV